MSEEMEITIALVHTTKGKRKMELTIYAGRGKKAEHIIAVQEIDLYRDHLPTMARTATSILRAMYTVHLDISIKAIMETL